MKTSSNKYQLKEEENEIYASYCKGEERRVIKNKFKISDVQFVKIIFNKIKKENKILAMELLLKPDIKSKKYNKAKNAERINTTKVLNFINYNDKE